MLQFTDVPVFSEHNNSFSDYILLTQVLCFVLGQDSKYFMNVTSEGNFITNARLDRDGMRGRVVLDALSVTVFDAVKNEKKAALNITVTDVNDNAPQFEQSVYKINITENQFNST